MYFIVVVELCLPAEIDLILLFVVCLANSEGEVCFHVVAVSICSDSIDV